VTNFQGPGNSRVLFVHGRRFTDHYVERILRASLENVEVQQGLASVPMEDQIDMLVVDYDGLSMSERTLLVETYADYKYETRLILLSAGSVREDLPMLFGAHVLTNLIARNDSGGAQELFVTLQKLIRNDVFGIEKYFPWGTASMTRRVQSSDDRDAILDETTAFAEARGIQPRFSELLLTVVDEMLTNALYNAPVDEYGRFRYASTDRNVPIYLAPHEAAQFKIACDGVRLGVSIADPFGSLSEPLLLEYLAKCFRRDTDQVDQKQGGAGLGLYYMLQSMSQLVVNISPRQCTEVIGVLDIRHGMREFAAGGKSFNVFTHGQRRHLRAAVVE
jgi:hypothetical protein